MPQTLGILANKAKIKFGSLYGAPIIWIKADKNHAGYPSNSTTLETNQIIKLLCFDAMEPANGNSDRRNRGNNRYIYSNLRQWLNSDAGAGQWYTAQHSADQAPDSSHVYDGYNPYNTIAGFLNGFTANERAALLSTTITVGKSSTDGGGTETCVDKIFPLSCTEVGLSGDHVCGVKLAIFSDNSSRIATVSASAAANSNYDVNANQAWYYWLRDAYAGSADNARYVDSDGALNRDDAYYGYYGLRPACNLSSDLLVSDTTDSDGCYTIVYNQAPVISGTDGDLGTFGETSPTYAYTVTDPQGGAVSVTEALDGVTLRTYDVTLGQQNTLTIPAATYLTTLNGQHTLTITATDSVGASTTRTETFTKNVTSCAFTLTDAFPADDMPTRCVINIQGAFPEGSILKVEICNNGNDATPTWETITQQALLGQKYFFTNQTKTASSWGVKVQASLERGTAEGDCYISSIGGVFQ